MSAFAYVIFGAGLFWSRELLVILYRASCITRRVGDTAVEQIELEAMGRPVPKIYFYQQCPFVAWSLSGWVRASLIVNYNFWESSSLEQRQALLIWAYLNHRQFGFFSRILAQRAPAKIDRDFALDQPHKVEAWIALLQRSPESSSSLWTWSQGLTPWAGPALPERTSNMRKIAARLSRV